MDSQDGSQTMLRWQQLHGTENTLKSTQGTRRQQETPTNYLFVRQLIMITIPINKLFWQKTILNYIQQQQGTVLKNFTYRSQITAIFE